MMTTTSLTSRVTTRLPFQTLSPSTLVVENDVADLAQADEQTASGFTEVAGEQTPSRWINSATVLLLAENAVRVLQPLAIGLAINDLIVRSYQGVIILVGQHLAFLLLNRLRQISVARQINTMIVDDVQQVTVRQQGIDETMDSRQEMQDLHQRIELLGHKLPQAIHIASSVCGALLLLAWYEWPLVPLCLLLVAPTFLLNTAFGRRSKLLSRKLSQDEDLEAEILSTGDAKAIQQHFDRLNRTRLQLVNAETSSFCLMQLFILGLLATSLIHSCLNTAAQPGHIVAVLLYVLWYATALNEIPVMIRNFMSLTREP